MVCPQNGTGVLRGLIAGLENTTAELPEKASRLSAAGTRPLVAPAEPLGAARTAHSSARYDTSYLAHHGIRTWHVVTYQVPGAAVSTRQAYHAGVCASYRYVLLIMRVY